MNPLRSALLWGSRSPWLERQLRQRRFAMKAVSRFISGEDADSALEEARRLRQRGMGTVLTLLGENVSRPEETEAVVRHYRGVLGRVRDDGLDTHISVKLTHLGLDLDRDLTEANLDALVRAAAQAGNFVWVDMEDSGYVDVTLDVFEAARKRHDSVGLCLQSYLYRTPADLDRMLGLGARIRLVKGAYREPASVAYPKKRDVDRSYLELAKKLLERPADAAPGIATHDLALIERIRAEARRTGRGEDRFEIQMLYGIQRAAQERLTGEGLRVRVLVSYGRAWFAWYMRRLAERPANIGFVIRSILGG